MKSKLKSGNPLVRFLLAHGEKLGITAILVCAGMLFWSSLGRERLGPDKQPDRLKEQASRAMQKVNAFTWDKLPEEEKPIAKVPGQVMKPVKPADFPPPSIPWNRSVTTVVGPRTDPVLLPPADLEVWADSGLWAIGDRETADRKKFEMIKEAEKKRKELERERERANKKTNRKTVQVAMPCLVGAVRVTELREEAHGERGQQNNSLKKTKWSCFVLGLG